jgi:hypothetical protein
MASGFFVVEGGAVTHHHSTGAPAKETLVAARIMAESMGCPLAGECPLFDLNVGCPMPQMMHCILVMLQRFSEGRICRVCGCTDNMGCSDPLGLEDNCSWIEDDLCSHCVDWKDVTGSLSTLDQALAPVSG